MGRLQATFGHLAASRSLSPLAVENRVAALGACNHGVFFCMRVLEFAVIESGDLDSGIRDSCGAQGISRLLLPIGCQKH